MKKTAVIFIITFLLSVFLIGCKEEKVGPNSQIYQLEVYNAIESSSDIYHLKYPHYYYMIDDETAKCSIYDFDNVTARENLSEEDYIYLTEYIMNLEDETPDRDDVKAYRIYLHYYDENGEEHSKSVFGYNDFPEGWSEFITRVNKICGGDYLSSTGDIVEVTPEFLTDKFGCAYGGYDLHGRVLL